MVAVPVGIALFAGALYYATRPPENGNGNGPPPGPCQDGFVMVQTCPDGSQIITDRCINGAWSPTGQACVAPPPQNCDTLVPGSMEWCRCQLGDAESQKMGEVQVQCPALFSLIPKFPNFPINPSGYIDILVTDKCGGPKSGATVWLSQSTTEWGGFVKVGTRYVNCARSGEMYAGFTGMDGRLRVRYLAHHNPGVGVSQSININIKVMAEGIINQSCTITINGTNGLWPVDPYMITQERTDDSPWKWVDCP